MRSLCCKKWRIEMNAIEIDMSVIFLAMLRVALPALVLLLVGSLVERRDRIQRNS
jgi:hypothetical protein